MWAYLFAAVIFKSIAPCNTFGFGGTSGDDPRGGRPLGARAGHTLSREPWT
jgi:hypothetical protein